MTLSTWPPKYATDSQLDTLISSGTAATPDKNMQPLASLRQTKPEKSLPLNTDRRLRTSSSCPPISESIWVRKDAATNPPETIATSHPSHENVPSQTPHNIQEPHSLQKCVVCLEEFRLSEGSFTCSKHFMDPHCLKQLFKFATQDDSMEMIPAKCCVPIDLSLCGHHMSRRQQIVYNEKLEQFNTDPAKRVHCHKCGWWLNPHFYDDTSSSSIGAKNTIGSTTTVGKINTIGKCPSCASVTCIECKSAWRSGHKCAAAANKIRPPWLPEYSEVSRVKLCPAGCHTWIELIEGSCNHVRCRTCSLEFCFICLTPWEEWHNGCPSYGEPACGYDADGYEVDRGIHRDTGLDKMGRNRSELMRCNGVATTSVTVHIVDR